MKKFFLPPVLPCVVIIALCFLAFGLLDFSGGPEAGAEEVTARALGILTFLSPIWYLGFLLLAVIIDWVAAAFLIEEIKVSAVFTVLLATFLFFAVGVSVGFAVLLPAATILPMTFWKLRIMKCQQPKRVNH